MSRSNCLLTFFSSGLIVLVLFLLPSCGKKGPPTLKSYDKPPAPVLLSAVHRESSVLLSWSFRKDKETSLAGFSILRSSGDGFEKKGEAEAGLRNYSDNDIQEGIKYSYKITSENLRGVLSDDSNIISLTLVRPPSPPQKVSFSVPSDELVLTWENLGEGILYNVYKSHETGVYGVNPVNSSPLTRNTFRDRFDTARSSYYIVRGLINAGSRDEGPASEEAIVDPATFIPKPLTGVSYFAAPDKVFLYWAEPQEKWVTGFRIYRKIENGDYKLLGETQVLTYLDKDKPESPKDYRIHAVGPVKEGPGIEIKGVFFVPER